MHDKYYVGLDNGVLATVAVLGTGDNDRLLHFGPVPVKKVLNYTKEKQWLNRIDVPGLTALFQSFNLNSGNCLVVMERPMVNPLRWKASMSAIRALEATLIVLEQLRLPYIIIDSREWQKELLPHNVSGEELKPASKQVGERLYPTAKIKKDADGLLIAEWARRKQL